VYLKRLELYGFKSFANKVELSFEPGITGIVGPNGSGKSNISDAIKWVLGEQSVRVLRGSRMEDVIFAGSDSKRSLGFAEVSLILDNSDRTLPLDFSEVMITRRLYRSGESEYLLNKVSCRLKDISELLLNTGIGRDGYSVVEQGRIDSILSVKPEDRRSLFEEAAGIAKYKSKKIEACNKLKNTEDNLVRLQDILSEINRQIDSLEDEAKRAEKYLEVSEELKRLEMIYYGRRFFNLEKDFLGVQEEINKSNMVLAEYNRKVSELEKEIRTHRNIMEALDNTISDLDGKNYECIMEKERLEGEIERDKERIAFTKEQIARFDTEGKEVQTRLDGILAEQEERERTLQELTEKINALKSELEETEQGVDSVSATLSHIRLRIKDNKDYILDLLEDSSMKRNSIAAIDAELRAWDNQSIRINRKLDEIVYNQKDLMEKSSECLYREETYQSKLSTLGTDIRSCEEKIRGKQAELVSLQKNSDSWLREIASLESRLKVLTDMENHYDGYFKGVREVMTARKKHPELSGVCAVVAEIIDVQPGYEIAMEVALGNGTQNIVCRTDSDAQAAIDFLKSNQLGRATFLSLNMISPRHLKPNEKEVLKSEGVLGEAVDFVDYNEEYDNIVKYLLGRIVIARDLASAREAAKATGTGITIVTLDGDIITPGGAITGGSKNSKDTQLLSRRRMIDELKKTITEKQQALTACQKEKEHIGSILEKLDKDCAEWRKNENEIKLALTQCKEEMFQIESEHNRLEEEIKIYRVELSDIEQQRKDGNGKKNELQKELEVLAEKVSAIKEQIAEDEKTLQTLSMQEKEILDMITEKRIACAALEQELNDLQKTVETQFMSISEYKERIVSLKNQEKALLADLAKLEAAIVSKNFTIEQLITKQKRIVDELAQTKGKKTDLSRTIEDVQNTLSSVEKGISSIKDGIYSLEIKRAKTEMERDNLLERMETDHDIVRTELMTISEKYADQPVPSANKINELRKRVRAFGNVNVGAIEEFKTQKERQEFLTVQLNDLTSARESLFKVIEEIDGTIQRQFISTFKEIREGFQELFVRLFSGGKADLVLTDENDVLNTGIDIIAQPPGKKPQHLSLLSNGERALTAIALLLAIMHINPGSFCVLDEIDAGLDDVNVGRFVELLKEFSRKTQLILVTHRKLTMESADCIYGVTMEQNGVSKVVSIKFGQSL
jgi:chromosome segregation protein